MYDYMQAVTNDIINYIHEQQEYGDEPGYQFAEYKTLDDFADFLTFYDDLGIRESVTGSLGGSYTMNRYTAKEYVLDGLDNLDVVFFDELCTYSETIGKAFLENDYETIDVIIRDTIFSACVRGACCILEDEFNAAHQAEETEPACA